MNPVNEYHVVTAAQRPDLVDAMRDLGASPWPEFLGHDEVVNELWNRIYDLFPEYQFALADRDRGDLIAIANGIPIPWDGDPSTLPPGGIDAVLEKGLATLDAAATPTTVSALMIVVEADHLGRGLSRACIEVMRGIAADHGLPHLVAPVRPTEKHRHPLIPMERYAGWRRADGSLFDPWLRTHERVGGFGAGVAPSSMTVRGTVAEWEAWTGLPMPGTGSYVVPGALVPVEIDRERDVGRYVEPNYWMVHRAG
jgi:GNAT superfamily N-acetyltransferase